MGNAEKMERQKLNEVSVTETKYQDFTRAFNFTCPASS